MIAYYKLFIELLLFKRNPQDIPADNQLLLLTAFSAFFTDVISKWTNIGFDAAIAFSGGNILLLAAFTYILLMAGQKQTRWLQAATAVFGILTLVKIIGLPISLTNTAGTGTLSFVALVALEIWFFVHFVRILRESLETSGFKAFLMALCITFLISLLLMRQFIDLLPPEALELIRAATEARLQS